MKKHFFIFLLATSFSGFGQSLLTPDSLLSQLHLNRALYSLDYPSSWSSDTSKLLGMDLILRSPKMDTADTFRENLTVFVQDLHGMKYDLSRMGSESELQIKNTVTDVDIIESRLFDSPSKQYYVLKYRGRQGKFLLITEQRYYLNNEVGFAFTFTTQVGKEQFYRAVYDLLLNSIKIL